MLLDRYLNRIGGLEGNEDAVLSLLASVCFNVDNVADYLQNSHDLWIDEVPNAAPPFDLMWFEHKPIPRIHRIDGLTRIGVQIQAINREDFRRTVPWIMEKYPWMLTREDIKWLLLGGTVWEAVNGYSERIGAFSCLPISGTGSVILGSNDAVIGFSYFPEGTFEYNVSQHFVALWLVPLLAISFMHCKNVVVHSTDPSERQQLSRKKHGRWPLMTCKTLEIKPAITILRNGGVQTGGSNYALHICRGHFKDYSEGQGLFGKLKSLYWWESQVRGKPDQGIVVKDYTVDPNIHK